MIYLQRSLTGCQTIEAPPKRVSALGEPSTQKRQVDYNDAKHGRGVLLPLISFPCALLSILKTQGEARRAGVGSSFAPDVTLKFSV